MIKMHHECIVKVHRIVDSPSHIFIVMERIFGGELFERLHTKGCFAEIKTKKVCKNITSALLYLHGHRIIHRDLKPENILLKSSFDDTHVKLCDFGFSMLFPIAALNAGKRHVLKVCYLSLSLFPNFLL
jgi:serine/threonine protein kinase